MIYQIGNPLLLSVPLDLTKTRHKVPIPEELANRLSNKANSAIAESYMDDGWTNAEWETEPDNKPLESGKTHTLELRYKTHFILEKKHEGQE